MCPSTPIKQKRCRQVSFFVLSLVSLGAFAANNARPAMSNKIMAAPQRYTASINQLNALANVNGSVVQNNTVETINTVEPVEKEETVETVEIVPAEAEKEEKKELF